MAVTTYIITQTLHYDSNYIYLEHEHYTMTVTTYIYNTNEIMSRSLSI